MSQLIVTEELLEDDTSPHYQFAWDALARELAERYFREADWIFYWKPMIEKFENWADSREAVGL